LSTYPNGTKVRLLASFAFFNLVKEFVGRNAILHLLIYIVMEPNNLGETDLESVKESGRLAAFDDLNEKIDEVSRIHAFLQLVRICCIY